MLKRFYLLISLIFTQLFIPSKRIIPVSTWKNALDSTMLLLSLFAAQTKSSWDDKLLESAHKRMTLFLLSLPKKDAEKIVKTITEENKWLPDIEVGYDKETGASINLKYGG